MSDDIITITIPPDINPWSDSGTVTLTTTSGFNGTSGIMTQTMGSSITGSTTLASPGFGTVTIGAIGSAGTINGSGININGSPSYYETIEDRLSKLEKIIAEEEEIRSRCEAVNNAYNEYRLLLVLAKKNKGDLLTEE